ncbi:MAG: triose-phosphate isomerase [Bacteroidota bacterium]
MHNVIIAGNWKMYKDLTETAELMEALRSALPSVKPHVTVVVCPPFTSLAVASKLAQGTPIKVGAQNMSQHDEGAFTGEISWKMLKSAGCMYVIVGHSERRQYFGETNALINLKAKKALSAGLMPIICVGETLDEREKGATSQVVTTQIRGVLAGITEAEMQRVVIAYEPVWAIGTGKTATPQQAQEVHQLIRKLVGQLFNWATAEALVIQYGGSVKPDNAADLLAQVDINGALVGGACLKADSFVTIINAAK